MAVTTTILPESGAIYRFSAITSPGITHGLVYQRKFKSPGIFREITAKMDLLDKYDAVRCFWGAYIQAYVDVRDEILGTVTPCLRSYLSYGGKGYLQTPRSVDLPTTIVYFPLSCDRTWVATVKEREEISGGCYYTISLQDGLVHLRIHVWPVEFEGTKAEILFDGRLDDLKDIPFEKQSLLK